MKLFIFVFALVLAAAKLCAADSPFLSVYQVIPGESKKDRGELILKLNNPTARTYTIWGFGIAGVIHGIEVQKRGKWVLAPGQGGCANSAEFYPLLPATYVVFDTFPPSSMKNYAKFRVTLRIFTNPNPEEPDPAAEKPGYIDLLSEPFFTKDLKPVKHSRASSSK